MPVCAECAGDEKDGFPFPRLNIVKIVPLDGNKLIQPISGFQINLVLVVSHHVAAAGVEKQAQKHENDESLCYQSLIHGQ